MFDANYGGLSFENPIMQKCWLVLGVLYYHKDATDFLEPITEETLGREWY